jgi:hypothetical protein
MRQKGDKLYKLIFWIILICVLMCIVYLWMKIIPLHPSSRQNSPLCLTHFRASGAEAHPPKWQRLTRKITRSTAGLSWPPIAALLVHELSCHTMNIDEHWYAKKNETFQRNPTGQKLPQLSASLIKNKNSEKFKVPLWSTSTETTNFCTTCGMLWIKWPPCPPPPKAVMCLVFSCRWTHFVAHIAPHARGGGAIG